MCESNAYIEENDDQILYLETVDIIIPEHGRVYLRNFCGEEKVFEGELKEVLFLEHRIVLARKKAC